MTVIKPSGEHLAGDDAGVYIDGCNLCALNVPFCAFALASRTMPGTRITVGDLMVDDD